MKTCLTIKWYTGEGGERERERERKSEKEKG